MNASVAAAASPLLANIPSPPQGVWTIGPVPIRAYALFIITGIFVAVWIGSRRWQERGGREGTVVDIAVWAVPFGLVGGRLYHVATDWYKYFGPDRNPLDILKVWNGGLGIWGAVALGAVGAWIGCRQRGVPLPAFADAVAPGVVLAQAIGRLGNYFNQELYGGPTDLPWGLEIYRRIDPGTGLADPIAGVAVDQTPITVVHPTFLYELLWNVGVFVLLIWADHRFNMGRGRVFALYVAGYTAGRVWIEMMRTDEATEVLGIRINVFTSIAVFALAVLYLLIVRGKREDPASLVGKPRPDDLPSTSDSDEEPEEAEPDETKIDEAKPDEAKSDETKPDDAKSDETKIDETKPDKTKSDETKPDDAKSDDAKSDEAGDEPDTGAPDEDDPKSGTAADSTAEDSKPDNSHT